MKKGLTILLLSLISCVAFSQKMEFEWVEKTNSGLGESPSVASSAMVVKPSGDMYLVGSNGLAGGGIDYGAPCFAKYNSSGAPVWVKYFDGNGNIGATNNNGLLEDGDGNMIAIFEGSEIDFDGTPTPTSPKKVLVKFDTSGTVLWVNNFGGNQYNILDAEISGNGDLALLLSAQFITWDGNTLNGGGQDILMVVDGTTGSFNLVEHIAYNGAWSVGGERYLFKAGDNSIVALNQRSISFNGVFTMLTEISLADNSVLEDDTIPLLFQSATNNIQYGSMYEVWSFDYTSGIAYLSGQVTDVGLPYGNDTIFGAGNGLRSNFIAKVNIRTGEILSRVVYYSSQNPEGVQTLIVNDNQVCAFITYRDTLINLNTNDVFTSIDTLPNNGPHPHCLIQSFDLDLNFNFYNQTSRTGGTSTVYAAGFDQSGSVYALYAGGTNQYFDNYFLNAKERGIIAKIGGAPTGISESRSTEKLRIYPNPTNGLLTINSGSQLEEIQVFDVSGKMVITSKRIVNQINLASLEKGVYIVRAMTTEGIFNETVVVY